MNGVSRDSVGTLRILLFGLLILEMAGVGAELILLEHWEDRWQLLPLVLLGVGLLSATVAVAHPRRLTLRIFQSAMACFLAAGALGLYLHYRGNAEFELEMYPSLEGAALFWESLKGATPALAPGVMFQIGLLGLLAGFRHPVLMKDASI